MKEFRIIFWDFDGVIKDSVDVKTRAFMQLFQSYGPEITARVRTHHEAHGGMSRYDKMPLYLGWAGQAVTAENIQAFCNRFTETTMRAVIDAPWVPGVREYLLANWSRQRFVVVTATPQTEMERILAALDLTHCFSEIHGAPTPKAEAIRHALRCWQCPPDQALVVGDSEADLQAAQENGVRFLLRRTSQNQSLQERFSGATFERLYDE